MKVQPMLRIVFLGILCCNVHTLIMTPVKGDSALEAWSCSPDTTTDMSQNYHQKVLDVLHAMEIDIMTYASWDLLYRTIGDDDEELLMGSLSCIPSKDIRNMEDCYACILSARHHLLRLCPNNVRGSVSLNSCTLQFGPVERSSPEAMDWDEQTIDDEHVSVLRAYS